MAKSQNYHLVKTEGPLSLPLYLTPFYWIVLIAAFTFSTTGAGKGM